MERSLGADALVAVIEGCRRHVVSEETNDINQIMATVSQDVCYMMPDVTSPAPTLEVLTERDAVRDFYASERAFMEVVRSAMLVEVTTEWYTFHEIVATTRQVATGTEHQNEVVVLFPVAADGIIGEILATRRPWFEVYRGSSSAAAGDRTADPGVDRARLGAGHQRFLDALVHGDPDEALGVFCTDAEVCLRQPPEAPGGVLRGTGVDAVRRRCALVTEAIDDPVVEVLNRVVGDWYVFADWIVRGQARPGAWAGLEGGEALELRSAGIFPFSEGYKARGEQTYSFLCRL